MAEVLALLLSYALGAIPFGLIVGKLVRGIDLRQHGSRNLGATNAYRVLGPRWGILVLLLDASKGATAVALLPPLLGPRDAAPFLDPGRLAMACGAAAVLGHVYPIYLGFRGGKGVATAGGVFTCLAPIPVLVAFAIWLTAVAATRFVSLGSLLAAATLSFGVAFLPEPLLSGPVAIARGDLLALTLPIACLVVLRHRANIRRLVAGTESRFGERTEDAPAAGASSP